MPQRLAVIRQTRPHIADGPSYARQVESDKRLLPSRPAWSWSSASFDQRRRSEVAYIQADFGLSNAAPPLISRIFRSDKRTLSEVRNQNEGLAHGLCARAGCCYFFTRFRMFRPALAAALPGFDFLIWLLESSIWSPNRFRVCSTG